MLTVRVVRGRNLWRVRLSYPNSRHDVHVLMITTMTAAHENRPTTLMFVLFIVSFSKTRETVGGGVLGPFWSHPSSKSCAWLDGGTLRSIHSRVITTGNCFSGQLLRNVTHRQRHGRFPVCFSSEYRKKYCKMCTRLDKGWIKKKKG
jgi:hypothetical protein